MSWRSRQGTRGCQAACSRYTCLPGRGSVGRQARATLVPSPPRLTRVKAGERQTPMPDKQWFISGLQTVLWDPLRGHMKTGLSYLEINLQKPNPQKIRELLIGTFPVRMWAEAGALTSPQYSEMNSFFCTDSLMKVPHPATSEGASSRCWGRGGQALVTGRV